MAVLFLWGICRDWFAKKQLNYCPAEGKIYEKLIGLDGLPIFRVYQINNSQKQPAYAEQNIVDRLVERVDRLEKQIGGMNHEPDADNGNVTEQR